LSVDENYLSLCAYSLIIYAFSLGVFAPLVAYSLPNLRLIISASARLGVVVSVPSETFYRPGHSRLFYYGRKAGAAAGLPYLPLHLLLALNAPSLMPCRSRVDNASAAIARRMPERRAVPCTNTYLTVSCASSCSSSNRRGRLNCRYAIRAHGTDGSSYITEGTLLFCLHTALPSHYF